MSLSSLGEEFGGEENTQGGEYRCEKAGHGQRHCETVSLAAFNLYYRWRQR